MCCNGGVLTPEFFTCEPFIELSIPLVSAIVKTLTDMTVKGAVWPDGLVIRALEAEHNSSARHVYVKNTTDGTQTDFEGISASVNFTADLKAHLTKREEDTRVQFNVVIKGGLSVLWKDDAIDCRPDNFRCSLNLTSASSPGNSTSMSKVGMLAISERWDWMDHFEEECGAKLCDKLSAASMGIRTTADEFPVAPFQCTSSDHSLDFAVAFVFLQIITFFFWYCSKSLLLKPWKRHWLEERKHKKHEEQAHPEAHTHDHDAS